MIKYKARFGSREEAVRILTDLGAVINGNYIEPAIITGAYPIACDGASPLNMFYLSGDSDSASLSSFNEDEPEVVRFQEGFVSALRRQRIRVYEDDL